MTDSGSDVEFLDYSFCDLNDEQLSIGQPLEPLPDTFEPHWYDDAESVGSTSNHEQPLSVLSVLEPERQCFTTLPSLDDSVSTVWVNDLIGSSGLSASLPVTSETAPDVPKPADVRKYMQQTRKVLLAPEDDDFECVLLICHISNLCEHLSLVTLHLRAQFKNGFLHL